MIVGRVPPLTGGRVKSKLARMLTVVVLMVTFATVGALSAVGNMTGYWQYPDSNQALGETVRSVLVSEGKMIFGAGDIGATGTLPSGGTFGIASYDGTTWSDISGTGVEARSGCNVYGGRPSVQVVAGTASNLYVAGEFSHINGVNTYMIARRTGGTWSALGQGLCGYDAGGDYWQMGDILVDGTDVYVTGSFRAANPWDPAISDYALYVNGIAKWNGSSWSALGGGLSGSSHPKYGRTIEKDPENNAIYVGGAFDSVNASYNRATQVFGGPVSGSATAARREFRPPTGHAPSKPWSIPRPDWKIWAVRATSSRCGPEVKGCCGDRDTPRPRLTLRVWQGSPLQASSLKSSTRTAPWRACRNAGKSRTASD